MKVEGGDPSNPNKHTVTQIFVLSWKYPLQCTTCFIWRSDSCYQVEVDKLPVF